MYQKLHRYQIKIGPREEKTSEFAKCQLIALVRPRTKSSNSSILLAYRKRQTYIT